MNKAIPNPEKVMGDCWKRLCKKNKVSDLIPACLFRYAYVSGWQAGRKYSQAVLKFPENR